nr:MAG TPA: hypothetical protein [Caudoviricetes sp.]
MQGYRVFKPLTFSHDWHIFRLSFPCFHEV